MEFQEHRYSAMMTLTYKKWDQNKSVEVYDIQLYLKRLRKDHDIRYFCSAEYNDNGMPHYHLAIFGVEPISLLGTSNYRPNRKGFATHHDKYWKLGRVQVDEINNATAAYICGYTLKKLTTDHEEIIGDRTPEFTLQSRYPPLGTTYLRRICKQVLRAAQHHADASKAAVQMFENGFIRINQKKWPLDNRSMVTIRDELGSLGTSIQIKQDRISMGWKMDHWTGTTGIKAIEAERAAGRAEKTMRVNESIRGDPS